MKKTIMVAIVCSLALGWAATSALASISLTVGDARYVGFVVQPTPALANPTDEAALINTLITLAAGAGPALLSPGPTNYDRLNSTLVGSFPTADATGVDNIDTDDFPNAHDAIGVTGFAYIIGKYDGQNWGDYVWYVPAGTYSIPFYPPDINKYGLSHYAVFDVTPPQEVPDGGMTIMLLGGALVALESLRRRLRA